MWFGLLLLLVGWTPQEQPRLTQARHLDAHFPFQPPVDAVAWAQRRERVRRQVRVAAGLIPGERPRALSAELGQAVQRDGYSVTPLRLETLPGLYLTASLYLPEGPGPFPGVLTPHGHWTGGRFAVLPEEEVRAAMARGEERYLTNGQHHQQARCVYLARLGCAVLHYDMLGNGDLAQVEHGEGFRGAECARWSMSPFGLQTLHSLMALDFLAGLESVDAQRIGVTGASGGGTQTFVLGAIDDRPAALAPAVMASSGMQGGCLCENAAHLRVGTGNLEFVALAAPRPVLLTAADDWTRHLFQDGLPELRQLWAVLGAAGGVTGFLDAQAPHNFNARARAQVYAFFQRHLGLDPGPLPEEPPLVPLTRAELSCYSAERPAPKRASELARAGLRARAEVHLAQLAAGLETGPAGLARLRREVGGALEVLLHVERPLAREPQPQGGDRLHLWGPEGVVRVRGAWSPGALRVLSAGPWTAPEPEPWPTGLAAMEPLTAELPWRLRRGYRLFTWGYNPSHLAHRVHDLRAVLAHGAGTRPVALVGLGEEALAALCAAALEPQRVGRLAVTWQPETWAQVEQEHRDFLPGGERWGGPQSFAALVAPRPLLLLGTAEPPPLLEAAYWAAGASSALQCSSNSDRGRLQEWLLEP